MKVQELIDKLQSLNEPDKEVFITPIVKVPVGRLDNMETINVDDFEKIGNPDRRFNVLGIFGMTNVQQEPWYSFVGISFDTEEHTRTDENETVH